MYVKNFEGMIRNNCKIIKSVKENAVKSKDKWYTECHCGKIFIASPNNLRIRYSCGCLNNNYKGAERKYNYYNYTNESGIILIKPVEPEKKWTKG